MAIQPTQPQGIGGVLDTTFHLYKSSLAAVWPLCLLLSVAGAPPSIYVSITGGMAAIADPTAMLTAMADPIYWLIYLVSLVAMMCVVAAMYLKQNAIGTDQELSLGTALRAGLGRAPLLALMLFLYFIAIGIGSVLLIVPGVILMVSLVLGANLLVFEGKGPVAALTGSHKLVWGNWWRTLVVLSIGGILVLVVYIAVAMVVGIAAPIVGMGVEDLVTYTTVSTLVISVVVNILVAPFFSAMMIALYWDLKLRKEGGDLAARVSALNAA